MGCHIFEYDLFAGVWVVSYCFVEFGLIGTGVGQSSSLENSPLD